MTALILVAASGLAREALEAVRVQQRYDVVGIVDDNPALVGELVDGVKVLGGLSAIADHPDAQVLLCAGSGTAREALAQRLDLPPTRYACVVHPSVALPPSCSIGAGSLLLAGCVLTASVEVGEHVVLMPNVTLTHDDRIGDYATLCAGVVLGGGVRVGERAYLGMAASVRQNLTIGADSVVGMGSVLLRDVPAGRTWFGAPARDSETQEGWQPT
ncbi:sugar O-acyltransferase (sialic acid O-acetyltransferase NeuD family) [Jatrophihabitans sp. GAS493]|uniref:acetyltransferase n=1 Tax=Jatrophihabitans sp. GAS493 TaxID=1907575 RepID=UPI000BB71577|nr:acetyltransferase [Jatrophihabitans sp. GAS493]SOD70310.1 sugar O-acyltransferase (sialic acid O-acetyltransferase NeuD family) [Jatrophihabitans sp. GAS493]